MWASPNYSDVIDVSIESEANVNGYIDFSRRQNSFKALISNIKSVVIKNLTFTWTVLDSTGIPLSTASLIVY